MPSKSLTLKFGADTTRLDAALKKLRRGLTKSIGGTARKTAGGLATGFLGGFAGGMFAGGLPGMAQSLFGELMDISPQFAMAMMNLSENIRQELQPEMEELAESVAKSTPAIARFVADLVQGAADFINIVRGEKKVNEPGFFTVSGAAAGLNAISEIRSGEFAPDFVERVGMAAGFFNELANFSPTLRLFGLGGDQTAEIATAATDLHRRRRDVLFAPEAPERFYDYQRAIYGDEGIAPGTI